MNRGNNYTVQQVLQRIQTDQLDDSCDENEKTELQEKNLFLIVVLVSKVVTVIPTAVKTEQSSAAVSIDFYRFSILKVINQYLKILLDR